MFHECSFEPHRGSCHHEPEISLFTTWFSGLCYGLNGVASNPYVEAPIPSVTIFGDGAFKRGYWGYKESITVEP